MKQNERCEFRSPLEMNLGHAYISDRVGECCIANLIIVNLKIYVDNNRIGYTLNYKRLHYVD